MMLIEKKNREPDALQAFRKECKNDGGLKKGDYDRFRDNCQSGFEELQISLMEEQHYLCCYCMQKIQRSTQIRNKKEEKPLTIEHYEPKSTKPDLALTYTNLLACCEGKDGKIKFCGNSKGNSPLHMVPNPSDQNTALEFIRKIKYKSNGEITIDVNELERYSENEKTALLNEINNILNLNNEILIKARTAKLQNIINRYKDEAGRKAKKINKKDFFNELDYFSYYAFVKFHFLKDCTNV